MFYREVIELVEETYTVNDYGDEAVSEVLNVVFADKASIRQSEFYQAMASGLKPELMFVIRASDYSQEKKLKYDSKYYNIIRTYNKDGEHLELICQGIVGAESR